MDGSSICLGGIEVDASLSPSPSVLCSCSAAAICGRIASWETSCRLVYSLHRIPGFPHHRTHPCLRHDRPVAVLPAAPSSVTEPCLDAAKTTLGGGALGFCQREGVLPEKKSAASITTPPTSPICGVVGGLLQNVTIGAPSVDSIHHHPTATLVAITRISCGTQWYCRYPKGGISWCSTTTTTTSYVAANHGVHPGVWSACQVDSMFRRLSSSSSKQRFRLAGQQQPWCSIITIPLKQLLYHGVVIIVMVVHHSGSGEFRQKRSLRIRSSVSGKRRRRSFRTASP